MPDRAKNDMGMPYSSTLFFFYPNLSVIGISLVSFFFAVSRSDLQLGIVRSFMPIYWGYAREMGLKAAWRPKPLESSRSFAFFFFSFSFRCRWCFFFRPPACLKKTVVVVDSLYVVIMVIRTRALLAGHSRYYPMALVFTIILH